MYPTRLFTIIAEFEACLLMEDSCRKLRGAAIEYRRSLPTSEKEILDQYRAAKLKALSEVTARLTGAT